MISFIKYLLFAIVLLISFSCNNPNQTTSTGSNSPSILLPSISGSAGEVLIVMDNENWKGNAGNILRETLEQQYPALPQPEPLFDVVHITQGAFDNLFQHHRSIIVVNLSPEISKSKVGYFENVWAKPQIMIKIEAKSSYDLDSLLTKEKGNILYNIQSYDRKRMISLFNDSKDQTIKSEVSKFNISLAIPRGYSTDLSNDEFASFSIETAKTSQVIFVYQYPYHGSKDFLTENIILKRNEFLKKYTVGTRTGSYLTTANLFPPLAYDIKKNGQDIVEIRGLWELVNGYMGGPFILHAALDQKRNMVVVVEGYVYNPNNKKRNTMRHLESIVYSMQFLQ
jgi:hypothetical protein